MYNNWLDWESELQCSLSGKPHEHCQGCSSCAQLVSKCAQLIPFADGPLQLLPGFCQNRA